jgi:hypothetical protein
LWWTGLAYSFGKPHHDKVALAFAIASLPFARVGAAVSLDAVVARLRGRPVRQRQIGGMPIRLTQLSLALGYCAAGCSKLVIGGLDWFNGYTLQGIMLGHDKEWSRVFASSVGLAQLQSFGVVFVQVTFPIVLLWPRAGWFYLPAATSFHLMSWKTMDTGPYMRLWLLLVAFLPLERVPAEIWRWLRGGPIAAVSAIAAIGAMAALVGTRASQVVPVWALFGFAAVLLAVVVHHRPRAGSSLP